MVKAKAAEKKPTAKKAKTIPNITDMVSRLRDSLEAALVDCEKFDKGVNAAGARIRKVMQTVKVNCKEIRDAVTEVKESRK